MPLAGKFPRIALLAAVLAPIFLALDLYYVRPAARELLVSNSLDFAVVLLAALCCFFVMRRAVGFPRHLWMLLGIALALEAVGQALSTYFQYFKRASLFAPIPSDIFFFVWVAPVCLIFFPRSEEDSAGFDWLRILDALQVAIVAVTMYLYFFYTSSRWHFGEYSLIRQILTLYIVRDLLLALGFFLRSRVSIPPWFRSFCLLLAIVFIAAAASDVDFLFHLTADVGAASWGDFVWMVPYLLVVIFALSWKTPASPSISLPPSRVGSFFTQQFLPIGLPLLVIFMAREIAREQVLLGWFAVTASVVASSARLILTNRETRHVAENLLATEKALHRSEEMLSTAFRSSPDAFSINAFPDGPYLEVNEGFTRLTGYSREETLHKTPSQLALWIDPVDRAKVLAEMTETGTVRDVEFRFRAKSGQVRVGLMSASLVELDSRACALVVVRDITARKEAEDILRTSEERFRSLVQNLHVGIATCDPEGHILFANQAIIDLVGLPVEQILGKHPRELGILPLAEDGSDLPAEQQLLPRVLAARQPLRSLYVGWRVPNNPDVWTLLDVVPEFSSTGEMVRLVVSITDLSEQRRAVEALRESEERFRTLVHDLHIAVVLHRPDGRVEYVNPAAARMFGFPDPSVAVQKWPAELGIVTLTEDGRELPDEERPVSIVLRTHAPVRDTTVGFRHPRSDKILWVFGSSVPHLDASGNLVRVITSFTDITEQRRASEALRQSEELFRTLVRDLHVGVLLHRPDGRIEFANPAAYRMFNVPEGTATGKSPSDFGVVIFEERGNELTPREPPVSAVLRTRTPVPNGLYAIRHSSSDKLLWVFGNAVPQFDADGNVIRVITSIADVSDMKNAERAIHQLSTQLLRLQDEERRRIGRELHDGLAQTVLAINLSLAQVRDSLRPDEKAFRALEKARSLTQQMSREIRTLSYLLHPPLLDDLGLVSAVREYAQGFSDRSSIDTQLYVLSDFSRLPQPVELALFRIVQESLANIQRHSGSATAKIRLRQEGPLVTLEIVDFGRGISALSATPSKSGEARLGVGIPGMRERISQLGGRLDIVSGAGGTTVRATISLSALPDRDGVPDVARQTM